MVWQVQLTMLRMMVIINVLVLKGDNVVTSHTINGNTQAQENAWA